MNVKPSVIRLKVGSGYEQGNRRILLHNNEENKVYQSRQFHCNQYFCEFCVYTTIFFNRYDPFSKPKNLKRFKKNVNIKLSSLFIVIDFFQKIVYNKYKTRYHDNNVYLILLHILRCKWLWNSLLSNIKFTYCNISCV